MQEGLLCGGVYTEFVVLWTSLVYGRPEAMT